jgi:hypothetical protein
MPEDDDEVADDEAECLREALWWLVALYRPGAPEAESPSAPGSQET